MKVRHIIIVFIGLLVFSGCSDENFENNSENQQTIQSHVFKLKKNSITVSYTAGSETIYLNADMDISWTVSTQADWLSVTPSSGTGALR